MNDIRIRTGLVKGMLTIEVQIPKYSTYEGIDVTPDQARRLFGMLSKKIYPNQRSGSVASLKALLAAKGIAEGTTAYAKLIQKANRIVARRHA